MSDEKTMELHLENCALRSERDGLKAQTAELENRLKYALRQIQSLQRQLTIAKLDMADVTRKLTTDNPGGR